MRTLGPKPAFAEMLDYYGREDVSSFIYEACLQRKIRMFFVPEMRWSKDWRDNFLRLENPGQLRETIVSTFSEQMRGLSEDEPMSFYPSFHATADMLGDYKDLVLEADCRGWRMSFDDLHGALQILDEFQVPYRIKFSGHRSLHLMIPWEAFPEYFNGASVKKQWMTIVSRVRSYFSTYGGLKSAHRSGGILRLAYSLNENTGLVSLPIPRDGLEDFRPWEASMYYTKVDQPWFGDVPEEARENTRRFLAAVFDTTASKRAPILLLGIKVKAKDTSPYVRKCASLEDQIQELHHESSSVRAQAAWDLMVSDHDVPMEVLLNGLKDDDATVRWFLAEALQRKSGQQASLETALELLLDSNEYVRVSAADLIIRACGSEPLSSVELLVNSPVDHRDIAYIIHKACAQNLDSIEDILQSLMDYTIKASEVSILVHMFTLTLVKSLISVQPVEEDLDKTSVPAFMRRERMKRRKSILLTMVSYLLMIMSHGKSSRQSMRIVEDFWSNNALVRMLALRIASALEIKLSGIRMPRVAGDDEDEIMDLIDRVLAEATRDGKMNMLVAMLVHGRKPTREIAARLLETLGKEAVQPIVTGVEAGGLNAMYLSARTVAGVLKEVDPDPVRRLLPSLRSENLQNQQGILLVLRALGRKKAVKPLVEMLRDRRISLRVFVVRALGGISGEKAAEGLIIALKDRNRQVRMEALQELKERMNAPGVKGAVRNCEKDRSKHVRKMARTILKQAEEKGE